jgi:hypothetical protein
MFPDMEGNNGRYCTSRLVSRAYSALLASKRSLERALYVSFFLCQVGVSNLSCRFLNEGVPGP